MMVLLTMTHECSNGSFSVLNLMTLPFVSMQLWIISKQKMYISTVIPFAVVFIIYC